MKTILVIEDEAQVRENVEEILEIEGFNTIAAANGVIGVKLAKEHIPDLIICDVMMPELDGYGVLKALRQNIATAAIPFLFLTAKASKADLRQGMELGADDYLTKPFKPAELLGAIAARFRKKAAMTQPYIDEMERAVDNLHLTSSDSQTNLPDHTLLRQQLEDALARARHQQQFTAVLCLGVYGFEPVSNSGSLKGDQLLQAVAARLHHALGREYTIAYLSRGEFSIVLNHIAEKQTVVEAAQTILQILSPPFILDQDYIQIHAKLGIALCPSHSSSLDQLLNQAMTAMQSIEKQGGNQYQFYSTEANKP